MDTNNSSMQGRRRDEEEQTQQNSFSHGYVSNAGRPIVTGQAQLLQAPVHRPWVGAVTTTQGENITIRQEGIPFPNYHRSSGPHHGGSQGVDRFVPFHGGSDHASFMQNFQAGGINSFPSNNTIGTLRNIPSHAFMLSMPKITPDAIQSRSFGDHPNKRARNLYACPPPSAPTGRSKKVPTCKREIFVPFKLSKPCSYKNGTTRLSMKMVTEFYSLPVTMELPKDMQWGGVYDGGRFLPGSAQLAIAKQCSHMDPRFSAWKSIPGCFLSKNSHAQLVGIGPKYMGGASLKPLYYPSHAKWSDLPRKSVYIPNPALQMTAKQLQMYKDVASGHDVLMGMDALEEGEGDGHEEGVGDGEASGSRTTDVETSSLNNEDTGNAFCFLI